MVRWVFLTLISALMLGGIVIMENNESKVCLKEECFNVEIASTNEKRIRGLKDKKSLPEDRGMLFIYPEEEKRSFWMKDVLIPLDIIWISKDKEVVFIKENAQPCQHDCPPIKPGQKAKYVLEVNAGFCRERGVEVGDKVEIY